MAAINFKSVGEKISARNLQQTINEVPIGIKTPLSFGVKHDGIFAMHTKLADQIQDNFRNLLLTNHGERLCLYDFGANLRELSYERGKDDFDSLAISRIRKAVEKYMPYIDLQTFESNVFESISGMQENVSILIVYNIPSLNVRDKSIEVIIRVRG